MEKEKEYMQSCMDWKKIWLLYRKKIWLILVVTLFAAMIAAGCYKVVTAVTRGEQLYIVSSDYYITFNEKDHPEGVHYYNAYTWDSVLRDDPIVDGALLSLSDDYTKEEITASISGEMPSDYRILSVYSIHANPDRAQAIADAYEESLKLFANKLDLFETIELWSKEACVPVEEPDLTPNVALLGALIGLLVAVCAYAAGYVLDDSVYVERDFSKRFALPFLGTMTKKESAYCKQELKENLSYLLKEEGAYYLVFASANVATEKGDEVKGKETEKMKRLSGELKQCCDKLEGVLALSGSDLDTLRKSKGAVLMLPWGCKNGNLLEKTIAFLEKQGCNIAGVVLYDAEDAFIRKYYNIKE